jgi:hypothetical protein
MRDDLLKQISALPPDADIGIQIGDDHLDIGDLVPWGEGGFVALRCHSGDLRDVLSEWDLPDHQRVRLLPGQQTSSSEVRGLTGKETI